MSNAARMAGETAGRPVQVPQTVPFPAKAIRANLIATSWPRNLTLAIAGADQADPGEVTISDHERVYTDKAVDVDGATVTPSPAAAAGDLVGVYYDDETRAGGAVTYAYEIIPGGIGEIDQLYASADNPFRHYIALLEVVATGSGGGGTGAGGGGGTGGPPSGGGGGGGGYEF